MPAYGPPDKASGKASALAMAITWGEGRKRVATMAEVAKRSAPTIGLAPRGQLQPRAHELANEGAQLLGVSYAKKR